ncbi:hypothetical protein FA13DRAFT_1742739, partial [Coprinellus micaceus]
IWLLFLVVSYAAAVPLSEQADPSGGLIGWYDPRERGGRLIDYTIDDLGEPLNVIISGLSDPHILTDKGFQDYTKNAWGSTMGIATTPDLGDGDMQKIELILARQHYFPVWGTCWESLAGGHHFRAWRQNGTHANSGAWFIGKNHKIVPNGWNLGRDWFVESAVAGTHYRNHCGRTDLLEEGSDGINHGIAQDGRVAVLTVKRL